MSWTHACLFFLALVLPLVSLLLAMNGLKRLLRNWSSKRLYMNTQIPVFRLQCREDSLYQVGQALERALGAPESWTEQPKRMTYGEIARILRKAQHLFFLPDQLSPALRRRWGIPPESSIRYHLLGHSQVRVLDWKLLFELFESWGQERDLDPRLLPTRGLRESLMRCSSEGLLPLTCCSEALDALNQWLREEHEGGDELPRHQGKVLSFPRSRSSY